MWTSLDRLSRLLFPETCKLKFVEIVYYEINPRTKPKVLRAVINNDMNFNTVNVFGGKIWFGQVLHQIYQKITLAIIEISINLP